MLSEIYLILKGFTNRLKKDQVSAFSAQSAFFLIMSVMPFLSILLTLIKYLPISQSMLYETILNVIPDAFHPLASSILNELFAQNSSAVLSLSVVLAVWSAAKGVLAIVRGLYSVYHVEDKRNYLVLRFISAIYTVIFVSAILLTLLLLVFSNQIYDALKKDFPMAADFLSIFISQKLILSLCLLTLFFLFVYKLVKVKHLNIFTLLPGAIFSSISWVATSYAFSYYIDHYSNFSYTYGSLAIIVLFMLWIYICMYILFIGAEINCYFKIYFEGVRTYVIKRKGRN